MNSTNQKIWNLIQEDEEFRDYLFLFYVREDDEAPNDFSIYLNHEDEDYSDINVGWLTRCDEQEVSHIGLDNDTNEVVAIDQDGNLISICSGLENLPYEIIRIGCRYGDSVDEYCQRDEINIMDVLKRYEQWCKDNGIELDKEKVYHDENGNLFTKYFDKY